MEKPALVIMAAGMGSRYGGMKQIDPVDEHGHIIMDFSIYDAVRAGFSKVIIIIKKEMLKSFKEAIGGRISTFVEVVYVFQELTRLPHGYQVPAGREKPWGTAHAILCCRPKIHGPFAVINADDFYGRDAFIQMYRFLTYTLDDRLYRFAMIGYHLANTLTDNGAVSRGICQTDANGSLTGVTEYTNIEKTKDGPAFTDELGKLRSIPGDTLTSLNMWGFSAALMPELEKRFRLFLDHQAAQNPLKAEFFIPSVVSSLIEEDKASVRVIPTHERWFGVTYKEDKPSVVLAVKDLKDKGLYPQKLWEQAE